MRGALLVQLPLNGTAAFEPSGNTPLAAGMLAAAAGLTSEAILDGVAADTLGDRALVDAIVRRRPGIVGFTLYSWNAERSAYIASRLREALPDAKLVAGGPEVQPDNIWLLEGNAFDLLVSGEGEPFAGLLSGEIPIPDAGLVESGFQSFLPGRYPDPWLSGLLTPEPGESVTLETIRGCPSGCVYCSYRRRHPFPRIMAARDAVEHARRLSALGGGELVFIDPTFNARPDFDCLLRGLEGLGQKCFAELRGEAVDSRVAEALRRAGFESVELGLQTSNRGVLERCGRPSDPAGVVRAAACLLEKGVTPVVDIIIGLPGDGREGPVRAATMLAEAGAGGRVQAFYLSALPGTELRGIADRSGLRFMDRPPYYVEETPWGGVTEMAAVREEISDILGYDADLEPRPLLVEGWGGGETFDLDLPCLDPGSPPSFRHGSLTLRSSDLDGRWERIEALVRRRMEADPFCVLDVVLVPGAPFSSELPDRIRRLSECADYSSRTAARHGYDGNLRISTLIEDHTRFDIAWIDGISCECPVVADVDSPQALPPELRALGTGMRLSGTGWDLAGLSASTDDPLSIFFESILLEQLWCSMHLGSE